MLYPILTRNESTPLPPSQRVSQRLLKTTVRFMNKKRNPLEAAQPHFTVSLWDTFHEGIRGFVVKRVPLQTDAEDIVQEIFLRIHQGASGIQKQDRVQAWVYAVARGAVADFYRARYQKEKNTQALRDDTAAMQETPPLLVNLEEYEGAHDVHEEVLSWLRPRIDELPEKYRVALILADVEGLRQKEVAKRLGLSLSGAKSRVQRARVMLGEALQACCDIEFGLDGRAVGYRKRRSQGAEPC